MVPRSVDIVGHGGTFEKLPKYHLRRFLHVLEEDQKTIPDTFFADYVSVGTFFEDSKKVHNGTLGMNTF